MPTQHHVGFSCSPNNKRWKVRCVVQNNESWKLFFPSCVAEKVNFLGVFSARNPSCSDEFCTVALLKKRFSKGYREVRVSFVPKYTCSLPTLYVRRHAFALCGETHTL